jgi:hypothetical protein
VPKNFREQLFESIDDLLASMDTRPVPLRDAYLLALFRAVLLYREPSDQANLLSTRVKNWLRSQPVAAADLVFSTRPSCAPALSRSCVSCPRAMT